MSSELNKIAQAGIVPKQAVEQMEQWQSIPEGTASEVGEGSLEKVRSLRDDLELQGLPAVRESLLDIRKLMEQARPVDLFHPPLSVSGAFAGVDRLKRYVFAIPDDRLLYNQLSAIIRPMTKIADRSLERPRMISSVSLVYNKDIPTHWFCETEATRA